MARDVLLVPHNHFDPTWRRCWDIPAVKDGVTVRPYSEVEDLVLSSWLRMAPRGHTFHEGQAVVWRKYLERHPEALEALQAYARDGRLAVTLAGETVQDTNITTAEGLIRNFLAARPFYRDFVGEDHPGLKIAWLEDSFGMSANMPQVLRGVGAEVACATFYRTCPEDVWVGLDGTKILCGDQVKPFAGLSSILKPPPCPSCKGSGCVACDETGMQVTEGFDEAEVRAALEGALASDRDVEFVVIGSEEVLPDPRLPDIVDEVNAAHAGEGRVRFATIVDVIDAFRPRLEASAAAHDGSPTPELNPAMSGCYVTRIAMKQRLREATYRLLAAEAALANESWKAGEPAPPPAELLGAWRHVAFVQFHDAVTGTHIDSANPELHAMLDEADAVAEDLLPPAPTAPSIPPAERFTPVEEKATMHLGALDVTFDRAGICSVLVNGRDVFGRLPYNDLHRDFRIGELVMDTDVGDAWGQRVPAFIQIDWDLTQVQLGDHNDTVEASDGAIRWRGTYKGHDPRVSRLAWTVTVRPSADGRRLDFTTEVDWDTRSHRLRAVFPVASQENTATWEIPFGFIERAFDKEQLSYSQWTANQLEYPALHWVRRDVDDTSGVALLNRGLPGYRWMPGRLDISLLRSPEWEFCVVEPAHYEFWDMDGQRDTGHHVLEYSVWPFTDGLSRGDLTRAGYVYAMPAPSSLPFEVTGEVVVTAWKPAEDGSGWILRLHDAGGEGTEVGITFHEPRRVTAADLLERPRGEAVETDRFTIPLHKHGILTLLIR